MAVAALRLSPATRSHASPAFHRIGIAPWAGQALLLAAFYSGARELAGQPDHPPPRPAPEIVSRIDYQTGRHQFDTSHALMRKARNRFPVTFFHLGNSSKSVEMNVVDGDQAREIIYEQSYFDMPADSIARQLPKGVGFAGLRLQEAEDNKELDWRRNDWVAFLGAAYFRAIGESHQYGLSARGVALDVAVAGRRKSFPISRASTSVRKAATPSLCTRSWRDRRSSAPAGSC